MPQLMAAVGGSHGEARYMLTGTDNFSYILDQMVTDSLIESSSDTALDKADMLSAYDGYRLKFSLFNMEFAVNDT